MLDQLKEEHFLKLARLIEDHSGIKLPAVKRTMVEGRLRKRVRHLGLSNLHEYGNAIFNEGRLNDEFIHLIDCVTTNKTDFFREPEHFDFLRGQAIPEVLRNRPSGDGRLRFWSAAASIGAEAYTIAMVAADTVNMTKHPISILGTDISTETIVHARRAVYSSEMIESVPEPFQKRYLMRARNAARGEVRIVPELRQLATFEHLNLMDVNYPADRNFDVIFCRNVLIYFAKATQDAVLRRLCLHLRKGGFLILGHSESLAGAALGDMNQVAPTIFQRWR